ncbi:lignin-forming anionic peroxidase [Ziziphus jujuba]|uniref:Peroxidase n=1 Tax=Ziziphus jujuba TaxID=326968 RepID=A0ABM3IKI0_ZIZJJ|nr:lignin-forming anionic peroxidase [Ziziphus jujuba]
MALISITLSSKKTTSSLASHSCRLASVLFLFLFLHSKTCEAQLSSTFYDTTCPNALATIRTSIRAAVSRERRMAASLIRLHFHDCFVQGCDASILLEDSASIVSEQNALANSDSARGYHVIEAAKSEVEKLCPGVVSCADILSVATRDASIAVGGPSWTVKLGRRDSTTASFEGANSDLPSFRASLETLISAFDAKGLNARDMVALSGSHTIGQAQCATFRDRINANGSDIDAGFAATRRRRCTMVDADRGNLAPLDLVTPNSFDNNYFKNLIQKKGLLHSDQVLFSGGSTDSIVSEYSRNPSAFLTDFASAMVKMGEIEPLTGSAGQIRRICSAVN